MYASLPSCLSLSHNHSHCHLDDDRDSRYGYSDKNDKYGRRDGRRDDRRDDRRGGGGGSSSSASSSAPQRDGFQNIPTGPRADRSKGPPEPSAMPPPPPPLQSSASGPTLPEESSSFVPSLSTDDLTAIRSRYLGVDKKKRKIRKMNDRKFNFDWDAQDDTFSGDDRLSVPRQGAQIMFGRGHIAGMDDGNGAGPVTRRPTVENNAASGEMLVDAFERRAAKKAGFDERHWSEKSLEEMKERDWRIFREDFSISARGSFWPVKFHKYSSILTYYV
jgi:ATP-dependent RNA helicase DDX23/PRP28